MSNLLTNNVKFNLTPLQKCSCDGYCNNTSSTISGLKYVLSIPLGASIFKVLDHDGNDLTGSVVGNTITGLSVVPGECLSLIITINIDDATQIAICPIIISGQLQDSDGCVISNCVQENFTYECITCAQITACNLDTDTRLANCVTNPDSSITCEIIDVLTEEVLGSITIPASPPTLYTDGGTLISNLPGETLLFTSGSGLVVTATDTIPGGTIDYSFIDDPVTGGSTIQVYTFDDNSDIFSWVDADTLAGPGAGNITFLLEGGTIVDDNYADATFGFHKSLTTNDGHINSLIIGVSALHSDEAAQINAVTTAHTKAVIAGVSGSIESGVNLVTGSYNEVRSPGTNNFVSGNGGNIQSSANLVGGSGVRTNINADNNVLAGFGNSNIGVSNSLVVGTSQGAITGSNHLIGGTAHTIEGSNHLVVGNTNILGISSLNSIVGGTLNTYNGSNSLLIGESNVTNITSDNSVIAGNANLNIIGNNVIVAGSTNQLSQSNALLVGTNNNVTATRTIVGGSNNTVSGIDSFVIGSFNNWAGLGSVVGGTGNQGSGQRNLVAGGNNDVDQNDGLVVGNNNVVTGSYNGIIGSANTVTGGVGNVCTGFVNGVTGSYNVIGGASNTIDGQKSLILGSLNTLSATGIENIICGTQNTIAADYCIVSGTNNNLAVGMDAGAIIGGSSIVPAIIETAQVYVPFLHLWGDNLASGPQTLASGQGISATPINTMLVVDPDDEWEVKRMAFISADAGNGLSQGTDGGAFANAASFIEGIYDNDAGASGGGVAIGEVYELSATNTYGLPTGMLKVRRV